MQRTFLFAARRSGPAIRFFSSTSTRCAINKICPSAQEAIRDMKSNTTVLVGGFGFSGVPNTLINAVRDRPDLKNFTVVSNNAGMPGVGLGQWLDTRQIRKMIASYIGDNKTFEGMYLKGELDLELTPQGTIAEKCAAGAAGVPAFYTPAAYGTIGMRDCILFALGFDAETPQCKPASYLCATTPMVPSPKWRDPKKHASSTARPT